MIPYKTAKIIDDVSTKYLWEEILLRSQRHLLLSLYNQIRAEIINSDKIIDIILERYSELDNKLREKDD